MSRFFSESRKAARPINLDDAEEDVQDRLHKLEKSSDPKHLSEDAHGAPQPVLARPDGFDRLAPGIVAARMENSRKVSLPRDLQKSLLAAQYDESLQHAVEAYRTLRTRVAKHQEQTGVRSIVISSAGPGEGKSLTSFNLAVCFAKMQNWPVLLVDADLRTRGASRLLGDPDSPGFAQILETNSSYESAILKTDLPNFYLLPAGESILPAPELFSRAALKEFINWSSEAFKLVLIDAPPILHLSDFELIEAACDAVALVVRLGKTSQDSLAKTCSHVDAKKLLGLVLNDSQEVQKSSYYRYMAPYTGK